MYNSILYLILQDFQTSKFFVIISSFFVFCQYCYLNFGLKIKYIWNDSTVDVFNLMLKYFTITINVKNIGFNKYLLVFYLSLGVVIFSIILIIVLIYYIRNSSFQKLPLSILQYLLYIILTFGYWPIIRMQFGLLACQYDKSGKFVMMFETKQECWTSNYTIHAIIGIIGLIITILFTLLISYFLFQQKFSKKNAIAMKNSHAQVTLLVYIIVQIMVYQMIPTPQYTVLIIIVYFILSIIYFEKVHIQKPFHHQIIQKMMSIFSAINFWIILMMLYSFVLEEKLLKNGLKILILGIPLICGIIISSQSNQIDLFRINFYKAKNGTEISQLCIYLLELMKNWDNNQISELVLQSYLEIHRLSCQRADCYSKVSSTIKLKANTNFQEYVVIHLINQIFEDGIRHFPDDIDLRLNFVFFLIDSRKQYSQALQEISISEQFVTSYAQQFQLFFYKRQIQEILTDSQSTLQFDHFAEANFHKMETEFYQKMEKITITFIEFWNQLLDEIPDIYKLTQLGYLLLNKRQEIEQDYSRVSQQNRRAKKLKQIYQKFTELILSDFSSKTLQFELSNQEVQCLQIEEIEEISKQPDPIIVIQSHLGQESKIMSINKSFCSLLGYSKADLINRTLNEIMPDIYAFKHNQCIENYLIHKISDQNQQLIKSCQVYIKKKNKYILPVHLKVKLLEVHHNELILLGILDYSFQQNNQCYIISSPEGNITDLSSNCISFLGIDLQSITLNQILISDLFPGILKNNNQVFHKSGCCVTYNDHLQMLKNSKRLKQSIHSTSSYIPKTNFNCIINYIEYKCLREEQDLKHGLVIRLEQIKTQLQCKQECLIQQDTIRSPGPKIIGFFRFAQRSLTYRMENIRFNELDSLNNETLIMENSLNLSKLMGCMRMSRHFKTLMKPNYGEGIRIKRLIENQICDIEDSLVLDGKLKKEAEDQNDEEEIEDNQESDIFSQRDTLQSQFFQKSLIKKELQEKPMSFKIKMSSRVIHSLLFVLLLLQILSYTFNVQNEQELLSNLPLINQVNQRMSNIFMIQSILQDIRSINLHYVVNTQNTSQVLKQNFEMLELEIQSLKSVQNDLSSIKVDIADQYKQLNSKYYEKIIVMVDIYGNVSYFTFNEAIEQLISKTKALLNSDISQFDYSKPDFFYFIYNSLNYIIWNGRIAETYYWSYLQTLVDTIINSEILYFLLHTCMLFSLTILILLFLNQIQKETNQIVQSLLFLKESSIKEQVGNCENFLVILQSEDLEDKDNLQIENEENKKEKKNVQNKKIKKFKYSGSQLSKQFVKTVLIFILFQLFYIYTFTDSKIVSDEYNQLMPIINQTSIVESYYRLGDNFIRELFFNPNISILNTPDNKAAVFGYLELLYNLNADLVEINNKYQNLLELEYQIAFNEIYFMNPCLKLYKSQSLVECENFEEGILIEGLSIGIIKYIEDLRTFFQSYQQFDELQNYNLEYNFSDVKLINYALNLLNTKRGLDIRTMQQRYLRAAQRYLNQALSSNITSTFQGLEIRKTILFTCFCFMILIVITMIWIPTCHKRCAGISDSKNAEYVYLQQYKQVEANRVRSETARDDLIFEILQMYNK
ncbi:unnamed protein product (macronuclear) [Paramecium tetraurelia]|uniref:PAS domain-containing protein n=1 Tax=Paramecium tetraurelia TaxID=5888 RepID=A0E7L9_PARTE|nr:uncharacterized protein GSPATT00024014001 [Paramecium tetraurelia]CAK91286.1 unnamed protein product [Paramecium tetraurelia]|eukprot:XP_001458683.1 hypothetical protein (macronuclear) [Paramecium tetraurelia strain d4-2]